MFIFPESCLSVPYISNGYAVRIAVRVGDNSTVRCKYSYRLPDGAEELHLICKNNQKWNPLAWPTCECEQHKSFLKHKIRKQ